MHSQLHLQATRLGIGHSLLDAIVCLDTCLSGIIECPHSCDLCNMTFQHQVGVKFAEWHGIKGVQLITG